MRLLSFSEQKYFKIWQFESSVGSSGSPVSTVLIGTQGRILKFLGNRLGRKYLICFSGRRLHPGNCGRGRKYLWDVSR